jgi:diguanylate cyclase (GGDEF)-like protein/PAS domain S-box-containing protein
MNPTLPTRKLLEHLPMAVSVVDLAPGHRVLFSNRAFEQLFGYSPQDIPTVEDWARLAYPDPAYRAEVFDWWSATVKQARHGRGQLEAKVFRVRCKDGSQRDVLISASVVDDMLVASFADATPQVQAFSELASQEVELRRLIDSLPISVAIVSLDASQRVLFLNRQMVRTFGYTLADIPTVADWLLLAYPDADYRQQSHAAWQRAVEHAVAESGQVKSMEFRVTCQDGLVRDTLINAIVLDDRLLVGLMDISERRQAERALRTAQEELEKTAYEVTEAIPVGTYTMVLEPGASMARFSFMSRRFLELTGLEREVALSDPLKAFACVHPEDFDEWVRLNAEAFAAKQPFFGQTRIIVKGALRWITAESVPRDMPDGSTVWEGVLIDVTDRVLAQQALTKAKEDAETSARALAEANLELKRLATIDPLTGTHNRRALENAVQLELERMQRYGEPFSLLLLDIDHFKAINDRFGHQAGDRVLVELSRCVGDELRTVDVLSRWGGEEFAVLLPNTDIEQARQVAEKLRQQIATLSFPAVGRVTSSFGVAQCQPDETADELFRRADQALYAAKSAGRNRVCVRTDLMTENSDEHPNLLLDARTAAGR